MQAIAELLAPPEVLQALQDGRRSGQWIRAKCPFCDPGGRKGRNLAASHQGFGHNRDKPGWICFACNAQDDVRRAKLASMKIRYDPTSPGADDRRRTEYALQIIERSRPIQTGDPVDRYLRGRQLEPLTATWPPTLRLSILRHPETKREYPTMVGIVTNVANDSVGIHRTFLTDEGRKADVSPVKMSFGPVGGGAVRLGIESDTIVIAEGIESAIGAAMTFGIVPWAALSTGNMVRLNIPRFVKHVIIAPDNDRNEAGYKAAKKLRKRIQDLQIKQNRIIEVTVKPPPSGQTDYADFG